jgi:hypothetical protein
MKKELRQLELPEPDNLEVI